MLETFDFWKSLKMTHVIVSLAISPLPKMFKCDLAGGIPGHKCNLQRTRQFSNVKAVILKYAPCAGVAVDTFTFISNLMSRVTNFDQGYYWQPKHLDTITLCLPQLLEVAQGKIG